MDKVECFKIRVSESESDEFDINHSKTILEIRCEFPTLKQEPITIVADPFLFSYNGTLFLFYERKTMRDKADIVMQSTKDLRHWTMPTVVLQEQYHLSFPFVFEDSGRVYMIPETCASRSIRLYEADDDSLTSFSFVKTMLEDPEPDNKLFSFSDSSLLKDNGVYYLFTSYRNKAEIDVAELYYSDFLLGPYVKHPCSPICKNSKYARAAGSVERANNGLYRYAQDCMTSYGENVHIFRIIELTKYIYREELFRENLFDKANDFYRCGGHQFNSLIFGGKRIIATDAKEYHYYIGSRTISKFVKKYN